jgi:hypothetical protein
MDEVNGRGVGADTDNDRPPLAALSVSVCFAGASRFMLSASALQRAASWPYRSLFAYPLRTA